MFRFTLKVVPVQFSKIWLSSTVGDNIVVIKCINEKVWNVNFSKNNGTFAFTEGWSKVVADLSLSEGCILVFRKINPYNYLLTPFFKEIPYPRCDLNISLLTSISSLPNRKYIEAFCHVFNDQTLNTLILPTYFVKNTIGLCKLRRSMKVHLNSWDSLDVSVEKDPDSKCYFFTDGWNNIVKHLGVRSECVNSDSDLRNATPLVNTVDDVEDNVDMNSGLHPEVASLFEPSDSDEPEVGSSDSDVSIDDDIDEDDDEDSSGDSDDDKQDLNYHPVEFVWEYHPRNFRLNSKVARMSRIDVSLKITIQNLVGVNSVVTFRPGKHGGGYRYVANGWRTNFMKPNGIQAPQKCTFVYSPDAGKLILKKVLK
ncbi:putative transcription factor B3-Domain family [Helianthus debilis subsp. tardiflorus]